MPPPQALQGVASLGVRPTVHEDGKPVLEVYLFDFNQEIYGRHLRVHFLHKLRDEKKYPDLATLTKQIGQDVEDAKELFQSAFLDVFRYKVKRGFPAGRTDVRYFEFHDRL